MIEAVERPVLYGLVLLAGMIFGGTAAAWWQPSRRVRSYIQHFAAGVVFAAIGVKVLPDVIQRHNPHAAGIGFAIGTISMLIIRATSRRAESRTLRVDVVPWAFLAAGAVDVVDVVDVFVDGMLIGVGFSAGERAGVLIAIALNGGSGGRCCMFVGKRWPRYPSVAVTGRLATKLQLAARLVEWSYAILKRA